MESLGDVRADDNFLKMKSFTAACCCAEALTSAQGYLQADLASSHPLLLPSLSVPSAEPWGCWCWQNPQQQHHPVLTRTEHLQSMSVLPVISSVFGKP